MRVRYLWHGLEYWDRCVGICTIHNNVLKRKAGGASVPKVVKPGTLSKHVDVCNQDWLLDSEGDVWHLHFRDETA